ncbi:MAG: glycosyltransferase, partial [Acidobacteria bacterium]|nr:glycosyltransferase [Acidobacteriota bacterium]
MRILYISHLFLPAHYGGTELYTYYLAKEARRRGHEVQVVCCEDFKSSRPQVILSR